MCSLPGRLRQRPLAWALAGVAVLCGCAPRQAPEAPEQARQGGQYVCDPDGPWLLAPPVIVVTPADPDDHFAADWNAVADSVEYPEFARRARMQATVAAEVTVGDRGRATAVDIVPDSTSERFLVEAARDGLFRATYTSERFDPVTGTRQDPRDGPIDVLVVFRSRVCGTPERF